jgi:2-dehydropantoate 2-reductase
MAQNPWVCEVTRLAVEEAVQVARAEGVALNPEDLFAEQARLATKMAQALSSTAQDIARGRRTEIDALNGYVVRRGQALGIPTPVNQTLHALVKLLEEGKAE